MKFKCQLCGSRLVNGRCEFCGLDNSLYTKEHMKNPYRIPKTGEMNSKESKNGSTTVKSHTARSGTQAKPARSSPARSSKDKRGYVIAIVIVAALIISLIPALIEFGGNVIDRISTPESDLIYSYDDDPAEYDPYSYVTREIPADGTTYETVLGCGTYLVGTHIPEGIYTVSLQQGEGSLFLIDDENMIYDYFWFGEDEEYDEITSTDDLRLYGGAWLTIDDSTLLQFTTANAQPLTQELTANPLTDTVTLREGIYIVGDTDNIAEGIYDIYSPGGDIDVYTDIEITYPNEDVKYLSLYQNGLSDDPDYDPDYYADHGIRNIVLPAGTSLAVNGDPVEFRPSEGYYDIDFESYCESYSP